MSRGSYMAAMKAFTKATEVSTLCAYIHTYIHTYILYCYLPNVFASIANNLMSGDFMSVTLLAFLHYVRLLSLWLRPLFFRTFLNSLKFLGQNVI